MMQVSVEMCSVGISFGRSKLCQSSSDFVLKPKFKPAAVTACLVGRHALVLYILDLSKHKWQFVPCIVMQWQYPYEHQLI